MSKLYFYSCLSLYYSLCKLCTWRSGKEGCQNSTSTAVSVYTVACVNFAQGGQYAFVCDGGREASNWLPILTLVDAKHRQRAVYLSLFVCGGLWEVGGGG